MTLKKWLLQCAWRTHLVILVIALTSGLGAALYYRHTQETAQRLQLLDETRWYTSGLRNQTAGGKAMGAVLVAGQMDIVIRAAALAEDAAGAARVKDIESVLEALGKGVGGDGAFIVNREGIIVVSWDAKGRSRSGNSIKTRPYFQAAMSGKENVYAAVGSSTGERALYIAAPVFANAGNQGEVIGVLTARLNMRTVDNQLSTASGIGLLLSPQGVVFASSEDAWMFRLDGPVTPQRVQEIAALKQFGKHFEKDAKLASLPFDSGAAVIALGGKRYAAARATLRWNDPSGDWSVLMLGDLAPAAPPARLSGVGLVVALIVGVLLGLALRAMRDAFARNEALAETQRAATQLAAEAALKARKADFGAQLQQARDIDDLSRIFFAALARHLPLHQAGLYTAASDALHLAGTYGSHAAPATIAPGEGLLGQCAVERRTLCFDLPEPGFGNIASGLGEAPPRSLLIFPVISNGQLLGVVELASLNADFAAARPLIEELLPVLSMNLDILLAARRTAEALAEARHQTLALQAQQDAGKEATDWLHAVLDKSPDGRLFLDESGNILLANPTALTMLGCAGDNLLGKNFRHLFAPPLHERIAELTAAARREQRAASTGVAFLRSDGGGFSAALTLDALPVSPLRGHCLSVRIKPDNA